MVVSEKKVCFHIPIQYSVKQCPVVVAILDFRSTEKNAKILIKGPPNDLIIYSLDSMCKVSMKKALIKILY